MKFFSPILQAAALFASAQLALAEPFLEILPLLQLEAKQTIPWVQDGDETWRQVEPLFKIEVPGPQ